MSKSTPMGIPPMNRRRARKLAQRSLTLIAALPILAAGWPVTPAWASVQPAFGTWTPGGPSPLPPATVIVTGDGQGHLWALSDLSTTTLSLWGLQGSQWTELSRNVPPPPAPNQMVGDEAMTVDPTNGQIYLYESVYPGTAFSSNISEVWTWNGSQWQALPSAPSEALNTAALVFDPHTNQLILWGTDIFGKTYTFVWDGSNWTQQTGFQPGGCTTLTASCSPYPADMVYDPATGQLIWIDAPATTNASSSSVPAQTDIWDSQGKSTGIWKQEITANNPLYPTFGSPGLGYDPGLKQPMLLTINGSGSDQTWLWTGSDWNPISPLRSPAEFCSVAGLAPGTSPNQMIDFPDTTGNFCFPPGPPWTFDTFVDNPGITENTPAAGQAANWTLAFSTSPYGALAAGAGSITLTVPSGLTFPILASSYWVNGQPVTQSPVISGSTVSLTVPVDIGANSPVAVAVYGVPNPAFGTIPVGGFWVSTSTDPVPMQAGMPFLPPVGMALTASPNPVPAGQPFTVSGVVYGQYGIPISGARVNLSIPGSTASVLAGVNGDFTAEFTAPQTPGPLIVQADTVGGVTQQTTLQVTTVPVTGVHIEVNPATVTEGGSSSVTGAVYSSQGVPLSDVTVSLFATAGTLNPPTVMTHSDGGFQSTFLAPHATGPAVIAAVYGSSNATATVLVTAPAPSGGGGGGGGFFVPVPPTIPAAASACTAGSTVTGPEGGELSTHHGAFAMGVAPGQLSSGVTLSVCRTAGSVSGISPYQVAASSVFTITGQQLSTPAIATFQYDGGVLSGKSPQRLSVYEEGPNGTWTFLPSVVDARPGQIRAWVGGSGTYVVLGDTQTFPDVAASAWERPALDRLLAAGIINGYPDGKFHPNASVSRAQFVKMLVLALGLPLTSGSSPYRDVHSSDWFAPYVEAAAKAGIVQGTAPGVFGPYQSLTREQAAVMLARALHLTHTASLSFSDASRIDPWALTGIEETVAGGYLVGFPDHTFRPLEPMTRAQVAQVVAAILRNRAP